MKRAAAWLAVGLVPIAPAAAQEAAPVRIFVSAPLGDPELAKMTGKFTLPNGVQLALSIVSDTVVNGQLLLRTVFTVDNSAKLQVFGRTSDAAGTPYAMPAQGASGTVPTGVAVSLDRRTGIGTVTPTFTVSRGTTPEVGIDTTPQDPKSLGLSAIPVTVGGPAVATVDGQVSLQAARNGTQVTLVGDQLSVTNLVGSSIANTVLNSANDRTIDTVTNVNVDLHNATAYQIGSAQMRVDTLALDATRGMLR